VADIQAPAGLGAVMMPSLVSSIARSYRCRRSKDYADSQFLAAGFLQAITAIVT
jgi:hypothetical protein